MSDDIETVHENVNGDQVTTKRVPHDGDVYEFEGGPDGVGGYEYEYAGEGDAPTGAVQTLQEHLGEDASVASDATAKYDVEDSSSGGSAIDYEDSSMTVSEDE